MANTTYTSPNPVTTNAQWAVVYRRLEEACPHLAAFLLRMLLWQVNGNNTISITFNNPLPADQIEHLGLANWTVT